MQHHDSTPAVPAVRPISSTRRGWPRTRHALLPLALPLALAPLVAQAESYRESGDTFAYIRGGTLGAGVGAGYFFTESLALRLGWNSGQTDDFSRKIEDIRYDVDRDIDYAAEALLDWYPFANKGWRLTAGLMASDTTSDFVARSNAEGNYVINSNHYSAEDVGTLGVRVDTDTVSPYLGVGWESRKLGNSGWRVAVDAGLMHLTSSKARISTSGALQSEALLSDIAIEQGNIKDENDVAPVLSVGISYAF